MTVETDALLAAIDAKIDRLADAIDGLRARIECPPGCDAPGHRELAIATTFERAS